MDIHTYLQLSTQPHYHHFIPTGFDIKADHHTTKIDSIHQSIKILNKHTKVLTETTPKPISKRNRKKQVKVKII